MPTQAESTAPSHHQPTPSTLHISSQLANLVTKTELAHLRNFIAEQFQLVQAQVLSKLDVLDSRLQVCEEQLLHSHSHVPDIPASQSQDPKGKAPLHQSPTYTTPPSHHTPRTSPVPSSSPPPVAPHLTPSPHSPRTSPPPHIVPEPHSTSPVSSPSQFELVARTPGVSTVSPDSEATHSDPRPPSPAPSPLPTPAPSASASLSTVSYHRRKKVAVSKAADS